MKAVTLILSIAVVIAIVTYGIYHYRTKYYFVHLKRDYEVFKIRPSSYNMKDVDDMEKEIYEYISSFDN